MTERAIVLSLSPLQMWASDHHYVQPICCATRQNICIDFHVWVHYVLALHTTLPRPYHDTQENKTSSGL